MTTELQSLTFALPDEAKTELYEAAQLLETQTLALRITETIGNPIENLINQLPEQWHTKIADLTQQALTQCLQGALKTIKNKEIRPSSNRLHKTMVALTGGLGGLGGLATVAVELPISTGVIFRSIADIARAHGENLNDVEVQLACLEVFAFGGPNQDDDGAESAYLATRIALSQALREVTQSILNKGVVTVGNPVMTRLIGLVAERFSVQVIEKVSTQLVPAIGALSGAVVNTIFIDHFQRMAEGHFTLRRLEREYGKKMIHEHYQQVTHLVRSSTKSPS